MVFRGRRGFWRVLGEVTEVRVDFKDFFHNFCDGGKFLKDQKQEKTLD